MQRNTLKSASSCLFLLISILVGGCTNAVEHELDNATVYFYDWNTTSRGALTPDLLKKFRSSEITVVSKKRLGELSRLIGEEETFDLPLDLRLMDGRLLMEVTHLDGSSSSYFADVFHICELKEKSCRKNDDIFRKSIESFITKEKGSE